MAAVTTRLEKQAELRRHSDRKLDELRGNLTMSLPHELRTPLSGIIGLAHLMMEDHAEMPPEEVLESSRFIHESAMRLHRLIENFLVYSQIELMGSAAKGIEISEDIRPVLLQELVPPLARRVSARHKREGDLLLKIESVSVLVPAENLAKIVEELTDNAFKFSEPGKPVLVSCEVCDGRFVFTVADKGRGMSAEQIARIAPHTQFDRQMYEQQGSGLGLFIAKRITELFGGGFAIESKLGEGLCVRVSFAVPGI
jgi:signal transduction histidine kinase